MPNPTAPPATADTDTWPDLPPAAALDVDTVAQHIADGIAATARATVSALWAALVAAHGTVHASDVIDRVLAASGADLIVGAADLPGYLTPAERDAGTARLRAALTGQPT